MFKKLLTFSNPIYFMLPSFVVFLLIAVLWHGGNLSDSASTLLSVTSFVFGFYISNLISQGRKKHSNVVEALREEGGDIKAIYYNIGGTFPKHATDKVRDTIDRYLIASMDYKIGDYSYSGVEFRELFEYMLSIEPENKKQEAALGQAIGILSGITKDRNRIETLVKERVSHFEWLTACSLLALVLFFVFNLNNGQWLSIIITSLIATTLTMLLVIIQSLDSLRWKEDKWFWEPLTEMFLSLDLVPYYPRILLDEGRVQWPADQPVRLADYPNPYPDMNDKVVTLCK